MAPSTGGGSAGKSLHPSARPKPWEHQHPGDERTAIQRVCCTAHGTVPRVSALEYVAPAASGCGLCYRGSNVSVASSDTHEW
jgi:hypothetical protein